MIIINKINEIINKIIKYLNIIGEFIYKYRFIIAIITFVLCVLFEINASSIGAWNFYINTGIEDTGHLLGTPKTIRSDEWSVTTPLIFSQFWDGFHWTSNLIRGGNTEVFTVYGLPILNIVQIFRPFQIGYLFLGLAKGLSFFWCGKIIALFLITFELCMVLTNKRKLLSLIGAFMISLAPQVQWWFATDFFIYGGLAIVLLYKYMISKSFKHRLFYLLGMILCAGAYIMILYPAYQVPMFYVFLFLAIWVIITNRKDCEIKLKDIFAIILSLIIFAISIAYIFITASNTISTIANSMYPGNRLSLGGGAFELYISYLDNIFLTLKTEGLKFDTCTQAVMFGLFPMGLIISLVSMIKNKKADLQIILLFIPYIFLGIYAFFGFPEFLAKISLMSSSIYLRALMALGFIDILLLLRGLTITEKPFKWWLATIISVLISIPLVYITESYNKEYITLKMCIMMLMVSIYLFYFVLRFHSKYGKFFFTIGIIPIMLISGGTVNPIRRGIGVVYDSPIIQEVQKINNEEYGLWIVEDIGFPVPNYILMAGVPVLNSTQAYSNLEKWRNIDSPERTYEYVYNRYSHIQMKLRKPEEIGEKFQLLQEDSFLVYVTPEDLKELDVKYIVTTRFLEDYNTETIQFEFITVCQGIVMYKVNYK